MNKLFTFISIIFVVLFLPKVVLALPAIPIVIGAIGGGIGISAGLMIGAFSIGGALIGAALGALQFVFSDVMAPDQSGFDLAGGLSGGANYRASFPTTTVDQGTPIQEAWGKVRLAGNIIRNSDPNNIDHSRIIIAHSNNQSEVTNYAISRTTHFAYYLNDTLIDTLDAHVTANNNTRYWSWSGSTTHTTPINHVFTDKVSAFRGLCLTEVFADHDVQFKGLQNFNVIGNFGMTLEIGQDTGGSRSFSRNPAQILWSWYIDKEGYSASGLSQAAFTNLYNYCAEYPDNGFEVKLSPPGPAPASVRESTFYDDKGDNGGWPRQYDGSHGYRGWCPFRRDVYTTGGWGDYNGWLSASGSVTGYVCVDMGSEYKYTKFIIENNHNKGSEFYSGVSEMQVTAASDTQAGRHAFLGTSGSGWVALLSGSTTIPKKTTNTEEPFTFYPDHGNAATPYRYVRFSALTNWATSSGTTVHDGTDGVYWSATSVGYWTLDSTDQAHTGTKSIKCQGTTQRNFSLSLVKGSDFDYSEFPDGWVRGWIYLTEEWHTSYNQATLQVFDTVDGLVGNEVDLRDHISGALTGAWQQFSISFKKLGVQSIQADGLYFKTKHQVDNYGPYGPFYLDDIALVYYPQTQHIGFRKMQIYGKCPRYTFDYVFDTDTSLNDAKKLLWKSFLGTVVRSQGVLAPVWEQPTSSVHDFTIDNIVKDSMSWGKPKRPNVIRVHYINAHDSFRKDVVELRNEDEIEKKGEIINEETCFFITEPEVAWRRVQYRYNKFAYTDYTCTLTGLPDSQHVTLYDIVTVSHPMPGWSGKQFMVKSISEDQYGRPTFALEAYFAGIYDHGTAGYQENYGSYLPNPFTPMSGVTDLAITEDGFFESSGNYVAKMNLTYTPPSSPFFKNSIINLAVAGGDYAYYGLDNSGGNDFVIQSTEGKFKPGDSVTVQVVAQSVGGVRSGSSPVLNQKISVPDIQAGLNALPTNGGMLILPEGDYILSEYSNDRITIPNKSVTLQGTGTGGTKLFVTAQTVGILNFRQNELNLNNLYFLSGNTSGSNTFSTMINHFNTTTPPYSKLSVSGCSFEMVSDGNIGVDNGDLGIALTGVGSTAIIDNCYFNKGGTHIQVSQDFDNAVIQNNLFFNPQKRILYVDAANYVLFTGNKSSTTRPLYDIYAYNITSGTTSLIIQNNTFYSENMWQNQRSNIYLRGTDNGIVENNIIYATSGGTNYPAGNGIYALSDCKNNKYINNTILVNAGASGTTGASTGQGAIHVQESYRGLIQGNTIIYNNVDTSNTHVGVDIDSNVSACVIRDNTIDMVNSTSVDTCVRFRTVSCIDNVVFNNTYTNFGIKVTNNGIGNNIGGDSEAGVNMVNEDGQYAKKFLNP